MSLSDGMGGGCGEFTFAPGEPGTDETRPAAPKGFDPLLFPPRSVTILTARGIEVDLCGHRARVAAGPAALALATGAVLHPVSIHYEPVPGSTWRQRVVITFHDKACDPGRGTTRERATAMTQQCADALGAAIREHTADWHMLQRVFVEDLDERTPARSA